MFDRMLEGGEQSGPQRAVDHAVVAGECHRRLG